MKKVTQPISGSNMRGSGTANENELCSSNSPTRDENQPAVVVRADWQQHDGGAPRIASSSCGSTDA